jgi:hypothetical protein
MKLDRRSPKILMGAFFYIEKWLLTLKLVVPAFFKFGTLP